MEEEEKVFTLKELSISPSDNEGKKIIHGEKVNLSDCVGHEIIILDYENGIKTQFGDNKSVILFVDKKLDELNNVKSDKSTQYKTFVSSTSITSILKNENFRVPCKVKVKLATGKRRSLYFE